MSLTAVSLFAGIEGIGLALHRAGIRTTAAVEIDPAARGVIADRMPDTTLLADVTKVSADELLATGFDPSRGVLAAGWPCQGNSVAGHRGGMADPRSGLWVHVARLLAELRPRWFLGENVPGLLSVNGGRDFAAVVGDLARLGYGYCWRVLDAQHFGVPQRRRRVFIVGRAGDRAAPVQVLLEPEGGGRDSAAGRAAGARVAATLTAGSHAGGVSAPGRRSEDDANVVVSALTSNMAGGGGGADDNTAQGGHLIADTLRSHPRPGSNSNGAMVAFTPRRNGQDTGENSPTLTAQQGGVPAAPAVAYALRADPGGTGQGHNTNYVTYAGEPPPGYREPTGDEPECPECRCDWEHHDEGGFCSGPCGGNKCHGRQFICEVTHALTAEGADASEDGTGRGTPLVPMAFNITPQGHRQGDGWGGFADAGVSATPTETAATIDGQAGSTRVTGVSTAVRRLTPLECERLQGFPDQWTATSNGKPQSDSARYRQLGNAVAVPVVEWIARRIAATDWRAAA